MNALAPLAKPTLQPPSAPAHVDLTFLLDRSGSMRKFGTAVVRAYDRMLDQQKAAPGNVTFSLNQFAEGLQAGQPFPLYQVPPLAVTGYSPTGQRTALLDSLCDTIAAIDRRKPASSASVIVVVITDGEENASGAATWDSTAQLVAERIGRGWKFILIGANQNAQETARRLSIPEDCALTFAASSSGVGAAFRAASANLLVWRGGGQLAFSNDQRAEQRVLLTERNL